MTRLPVTMTQLDYTQGLESEPGCDSWNPFGKSPEFGSEFYFADVESPPRSTNRDRIRRSPERSFHGLGSLLLCGQCLQRSRSGWALPADARFISRQSGTRPLADSGTAFSAVKGVGSCEGNCGCPRTTVYQLFKDLLTQDHVLGVEYSGIPDGALSADVSWEWIREFEQALEKFLMSRSRVRLRQPSLSAGFPQPDSLLQRDRIPVWGVWFIWFFSANWSRLWLGGWFECWRRSFAIPRRGHFLLKTHRK